MPRLPGTTSRLEEAVRRLESELFVTRMAMIGLVRPEFERALDVQFSCKTFEAASKWAERSAESIIELAARSEQPTERERDGRYRVLCPLCNQGPQSPYDRGFLLPEGLRRHLLGTYSAKQCPVFRAAHEIALDGAREAAGRGWLPR